jgi:2-pyrone-4,6-dicarboxylate lactonase
MHCHVFGPASVFPYSVNRPYNAPDCPVEYLWKMHATLGFQRGVIVQSAMHGNDNSALLDALRRSGAGYKGVVTLSGDESDSHLEEMHDAGVRGVRFNFVRFLGGPPDKRQFDLILQRIAPLGWHVVIHAAGNDLLENAEVFRLIRVPVVLDHMGRPDVLAGPQKQGFRYVVENVRHHGWWVKLSNGERLSRTGPPWLDLRPFANALIEADSSRLLWGTDWPHPKYDKKPPNDADLLELLISYCDDKAVLNKVLVENPARLLDF